MILYLIVQPSMPILDYDTQAAIWHAEQRARLRAIGRTPPFPDSQIAAVAATQHLTLVTLNTADYLYFADLALEDWRTLIR